MLTNVNHPVNHLWPLQGEEAGEHRQRTAAFHKLIQPRPSGCGACGDGHGSQWFAYRPRGREASRAVGQGLSQGRQWWRWRSWLGVLDAWMLWLLQWLRS